MVTFTAAPPSSTVYESVASDAESRIDVISTVGPPEESSSLDPEPPQAAPNTSTAGMGTTAVNRTG